MKNCRSSKNQTTNRVLLAACATALAVGFTVALPQPAFADDVTPPPVPTNIAVPAGNVPFLVGHGVGTQNYVCLPSGAGVAFTLFTPEAHLFSNDEKQVTSHFFSPNPFEHNTNPALAAVGPIRATWRHSRDSSTVWAQAKAVPPLSGVIGKVQSVTDSSVEVQTPSGVVHVDVKQPLTTYKQIPSDLSHVTSTSYVGVASTEQADGKEVAKQIIIFPEELRGAEGQ